MKQYKLLIADDDKEFTAQLQERFMDDEEVDLLCVTNDGYDAIKKTKSFKPDLLFLDIVLQNVDGLGVIRTLTTQKLEKPLKIMVCTYLSDQKIIETAVKSGAQFFIKKPANIDIVCQRIKEILHDHINTEVKTTEDRNMMQTIKSATRSVDEKINSILLALGIPGHIKGFKNIKDAVKLVIDDYNLINYITKQLYPKVAELNNTEPSRVERAIRHAIEVASNKNKFENLNKMFGLKLYGPLDKPTNGELIALIANKVITDGTS